MKAKPLSLTIKGVIEATVASFILLIPVALLASIDNDHGFYWMLLVAVLGYGIIISTTGAKPSWTHIPVMLCVFVASYFLQTLQEADVALEALGTFYSVMIGVALCAREERQ